MNKTLIALAIVAALPVAAQADATLSGSVTTKYTQGGSTDTDAALSISSSEVLANGMTATATFDVLGGENQGTASLAGDFGTLTAGEIDSDGAFQAGDVAGTVGDSTDADEDSTSVFGVHFSGTAAGLTIAAQLNGASGATGVSQLDDDASVAAALAATPSVVQAPAADPATKGTQMSATYDLNGLLVGYSYANAKASDDSVDGLLESQTAFGVSYAFGDLAVTAGKTSAKENALISATYTLSADAFTVVAQMDNYHSATDSNDYQINMSYDLGNGIMLSSEVDKAKTTTMVASYTMGDMTAMVAKTDDGTTDASVALDFGNADLTLGRNGGDEETSLTYAVAF